MDETFFQAWAQELRAFHQDTVARLAAHEEQMQEMRAERQVWMQTHARQMAGLQAIMDRLAAGVIDHQGRISQNERTFEALTTTLQAINAKL
jgi:hypothetical protein